VHTAHVDGQEIFLVDTPGFEDTTRSDTDILNDVAAWLKRSYDANIKLAGIVYLHRIQDNRITLAGAANIHMFKELCGSDNLSCVVLATTMWDCLTEQNKPQAVKREAQLKEEFWGEMVRNGSNMFRQDGGPGTAEAILRHIVAQRHRATLQIQEEIAKGVPVSETSAGKVLQQEIETMKSDIARMREDIERLTNTRSKGEKQKQMIEKLGEQIRTLEERLEKNERQRQNDKWPSCIVM
jgi:flagellar biosynthesis chaperone FliJ